MPESQRFRELRVESWEEFVQLITDTPYSNWAFRGQRHGEWPLYSALSRYLKDFRIDPRAWPEQEERILRIFKRKAHQYLRQPPGTDDDFQWLALMQHHGAPTRLLDFTWSPYVAAYFALERTLGNGAVWALNPARVLSRRTEKSMRVDPRIKGNYERYYLRGTKPLVWLGEPHTMNPRLIAQSGTFVLPSVLDRPLDDILSTSPGCEQTVVKLILPSDKVREKGMRELYRMNITYSTLFPDLEGLARSLAYELEFHWAYNPRTMEPYETA